MGERRKKLAYGCQLIIVHPDIAHMSCDKCEIYVHTDGIIQQTGKPAPKRSIGKAGRLIPPTPCNICPKIPKESPVKSRAWALDLTPKLQQTLTHYRECSAVNQFPDDAIVKHNAGIIKTAFEAIDVRGNRLEVLLTTILQMKAVGGASDGPTRLLRP